MELVYEIGWVQYALTRPSTTTREGERNAFFRSAKLNQREQGCRLAERSGRGCPALLPSLPESRHTTQRSERASPTTIILPRACRCREMYSLALQWHLHTRYSNRIISLLFQRFRSSATATHNHARENVHARSRPTSPLAHLAPSLISPAGCRQQGRRPGSAAG